MTKFYWVRYVSKNGGSMDKAFDTEKKAKAFVKKYPTLIEETFNTIKGTFEVTNEFKFQSIKRY